MYGYRGKIGLLVPEVNTTMEMDFHRFVPRGVSIHVARVPYEEVEASVDSLSGMVKSVDKASREVAQARVDIICFGCTSASFFRGRGWDEKLIDRMTQVGGISAITTSTAVLAALKALGVKKLSVVTPYPDEINETLNSFLTDNGFQITKIEGLQIRDVWEHAKVSPEIIYNLARRVNVPEAQAVFVSCTQLRAIDIIQELEGDIGKPVITAVQASLWLSLRKIGVFEHLKNLGKLGELQ